MIHLIPIKVLNECKYNLLEIDSKDIDDELNKMIVSGKKLKLLKSFDEFISENKNKSV